MAPRGSLFSPRVLAHLLLLRPLLKLLFGAGVEGRENLRGLEQLILVANHNSHLDTAFLFQALPLRLIPTTHPVAAYDYFSRSRVLFFLAERLFHPVWIVRGGKEEDPLRGMRERLRAGASLIIFPEGTRGVPGELASFRTGVGRLAVEFPQLPLVPAFLSGAERAFPKSAPFPVPVWTRVVVGRPRRLADEAGAAEGGVEGDAARAAEIAGALREMVRELGESEEGRRHRRAPRRPRAPALAVLGIDGSGKSTLSRELARRLSARGRTVLISDGVELFGEGEPERIQPLLTERVRQAVGRRAKRAASLKSYKIPKLAELLLRDRMGEEVRRWYTPELVVADGSPLLNMAAWSRLYREEGFDEALCAAALGVLGGREEPPPGAPVYSAFPELAAMKRLKLTGLGCPDAVLFLDVDPALAVERIGSRGEERQVHETLEKLARLREGYLTVCRVLEGRWGIPVRILEGGGGREEVTGAALDAVREMGVFGEPRDGAERRESHG